MDLVKKAVSREFGHGAEARVDKNAGPRGKKREPLPRHSGGEQSMKRKVPSRPPSDTYTPRQSERETALARLYFTNGVTRVTSARYRECRHSCASERARARGTEQGERADSNSNY